MHRLLELVLIPASHPHLTSPHPWAPWMAHQSHTGRNHTSPHMINSIYLPWTCFFISLAGSSHVCKRIKTFTVYQTFQKHHRKLQIAKNTEKKKKRQYLTQRQPWKLERWYIFHYFYSRLWSRWVYFQPFTYQGLIRKLEEQEGEKKQNIRAARTEQQVQPQPHPATRGTCTTPFFSSRTFKNR